MIVDLCQSHVIARTMDSGTRNPAEVKSNLVRTWTDILQVSVLVTVFVVSILLTTSKGRCT